MNVTNKGLIEILTAPFRALWELIKRNIRKLVPFFILGGVAAVFVALHFAGAGANEYAFVSLLVIALLTLKFT